ncbi:sulfite exporter TauE/SafE family protein [Acidobacteriota bacterium]
MSDISWLLLPILFIVALIYSSVGLGGGSSYIAVLYLFGIPLIEIPPLALFFNIIVSAVAVYRFGRSGYVIPRLAFPFLLFSIPAVFFGSRLELEEKTLSIVFMVVLFLVALALLFKKKEAQTKLALSQKGVWILAPVLGTVLGFLAGVIGIGGGIFLGPVLLLIGFASSKHVAGICSVFVLVNSIFGLSFHYLQGGVDVSGLLLLGGVVFVGAQLGSFLGTKKISPLVLQKTFALLLLYVSIKLGLGI